MPEFIDTHAHIYLSQFKEDSSKAIHNAGSQGVSKILMPNIDSKTIEDMLSLEATFPGKCFPMMGLHPCSVDNDFRSQLKLVEQWLENRKFCAVGEIGMDLYWDKTFQKEQAEAFEMQIELAKKHELPIVIHCRDAFEETIDIVEQLNDEKLSGVFHCFSGTIEDANRIIAQGFLLGIGGVTTFKNGGLDKVIPFIDLDHLVLETDSPYLAPAPYRGKRNEPAYIPIIAEKIADLTGESVSKIASTTTKNAEALFRI